MRFFDINAKTTARDRSVVPKKISIDPKSQELTFYDNIKGLKGFFELYANPPEGPKPIPIEMTTDPSESQLTVRSIQGDLKDIIEICLKHCLFDEISSKTLRQFLDGESDNNSKCTIL